MNLLAARDRLLRFPELCANGHGGHQYDSRFCRICGTPLDRRNTMPAPDDTGKPDVSWTDGLEDKMRAALAGLGQPTGGSPEALFARLVEADKPAGWKWEG